MRALNNVITLSTETCQLSIDCLVLECSGGGLGLTTSLTLSPCDYSVTLKLFSTNGINYEQTLVQSDISPSGNPLLSLLVDVTVARFKDGKSVGLQVQHVSTTRPLDRDFVYSYSYSISDATRCLKVRKD